MTPDPPEPPAPTYDLVVTVQNKMNDARYFYLVFKNTFGNVTGNPIGNEEFVHYNDSTTYNLNTEDIPSSAAKICVYTSTTNPSSSGSVILWKEYASYGEIPLSGTSSISGVYWGNVNNNTVVVS